MGDSPGLSLASPKPSGYGRLGERRRSAKGPLAEEKDQTRAKSDLIV
jgi:hypothetical protein